MIFLWILVGIFGLVTSMALLNWWRDEQEKLGKRKPPPMSDLLGRVPASIPTVASPATPLHPSIDPYLAELRTYLLQPPLPAGPGEMAERVYEHLTGWVNTHLSENAANTYDADELLVEPQERFINASRNDQVSTSYFKDLLGDTHD